MSGRWFGRRGRVALLVALLAAWAAVLYATHRPDAGPARARAAPASSAASAPRASASAPAH